MFKNGRVGGLKTEESESDVQKRRSRSRMFKNGGVGVGCSKTEESESDV
jgi:hypothetical protein